MWQVKHVLHARPGPFMLKAEIQVPADRSSGAGRSAESFSEGLHLFFFGPIPIFFTHVRRWFFLCFALFDDDAVRNQDCCMLGGRWPDQ
jgi:hypothetical protein